MFQMLSDYVLIKAALWNWFRYDKKKRLPPSLA